MAGLVAVNGQISPLESALIPAQDRAFLFGDGLFESIAAVDGRLIDIAPHLQRLRRGAAVCRIDIPWSDAMLQFEMEHLLSLIAAPRCSVKLLISRGLGIAPRPSGQESPQRYVFCTPAPPVPQELLEQGARLRTKRHPNLRRGEQVKATFYLPAITAQLESQHEGFDEVLWINSEGEFTEGSFANIFLIAREGDLVEIATPPIQVGILPGITRARVIELLQRSRIPVTERSITLEELPRFDEAFLCSSIRGLVPVQLIDRHRLHSCRPQSIFRQIQRLYATWEVQEGGAQAGDETQH